MTSPHLQDRIRQIRLEKERKEKKRIRERDKVKAQTKFGELGFRIAAMFKSNDVGAIRWQSKLQLYQTSSVKKLF